MPKDSGGLRTSRSGGQRGRDRWAGQSGRAAAPGRRRASRSGGKYAEALRRAQTGEAPRTPHVLRFLAEHSANLYHLVGGVAAAWAHSGQRVLLLEEAEDYRR
ncbi:hypothetical protein [Streptomyces sp. NPDC091268]|uniref:hypothetical protein n=1 Tax=Streptomyces sp. NPDC091268 TaxID=3365979 RepID=UPI003807C431